MAARKNPEVADVENRFAFHPATETTGPKHDAVRATLLRVAKQMQRDLPDGREKSLVLTKLEETMFWANAAIARHQDVASSDAPAPPREADGGQRRARKAAQKAAPVKSTRRVTRRTQS
jgi:hypothetical protein